MRSRNRRRRTAFCLSAALAAGSAAAGPGPLPPEPEPLGHLAICSAHGAGHFRLPGTDTCLSVRGAIRLDNSVFSATGTWTALSGQSVGTASRSASAYGFETRPYLYLDARTPTEFGLLRAYVDVYADLVNADAPAPGIDNAFVTLAGLTVGRTQSFFDFLDAAPGETDQFINAGYSDQTTNVAAYTARLGGGFSVTLSAEDNLARSLGVVDGTGRIDVGGGRLPDLVGVLRLVRPWGKARLSGALHEVNTVESGRAFGFAMRGGAVVGLPVGRATRFGVQVAFGRGATSYVYTNATGGLFLDPTDPSTVIVTAVDGVASGGGIGLVDAFAIAAGVQTSLARTVTASLNVGYTRIDAPDLDVGGVPRDGDFANLGLEALLGWTPVRGLFVGLDAQYQFVDLATRTFVGSPVALPDEPELLTVFVRIERDF